MTEQRDWDKELAAIDRVMAKGGAPAAPAPLVRAGDAAVAPAPRTGSPVTRRRDLVGVWLKALLAAAGALALAIWPYAHACGTGLYLYLALTAVIVLAGLWVMHASWKHRRPVAHAAGVVILLGALVLVLAQVLPRVGYAARALSWGCHLP